MHHKDRRSRTTTAGAAMGAGWPGRGKQRVPFAAGELWTHAVRPEPANRRSHPSVAVYEDFEANHESLLLGEQRS
jgi:hypothetical protein